MQVTRQVMTAEAEALIPMAELAARWAVRPNTVSRRLAFLGIKPIRQGNYRFLTPEQVEQAPEPLPEQAKTQSQPGLNVLNHPAVEPVAEQPVQKRRTQLAIGLNTPDWRQIDKAA